MLNWLIRVSLANRLLVCVLAVALIIIGGRSLRLLPIDAFPDTTPPCPRLARRKRNSK